MSKSSNGLSTVGGATGDVGEVGKLFTEGVLIDGNNGGFDVVVDGKRGVGVMLGPITFICADGLNSELEMGRTGFVRGADGDAKLLNRSSNG